MLLQYHPDRPPAGASGPREIGAFSATLAEYPEMIGGWGRDEQSALELLADLLRSDAADSPPRGGLTPYGQALMAAHRLTRTDLIDYLRGRAEEATWQPTQSRYPNRRIDRADPGARIRPRGRIANVRPRHGQTVGRHAAASALFANHA